MIPIEKKKKENQPKKPPRQPRSQYLETSCRRNRQPGEIALLPAQREAEQHNSWETQTGNLEVWQPTPVFADQVHPERQRLCCSGICIHKRGQTLSYGWHVGTQGTRKTQKSRIRGRLICQLIFFFSPPPLFLPNCMRTLLEIFCAGCFSAHLQLPHLLQRTLKSSRSKE